MNEKWKYEQVQKYQDSKYLMQEIEADLVTAKEFFICGDYDTVYRMVSGIATYMELYSEDFYNLSKEEQLDIEIASLKQHIAGLENENKELRLRINLIYFQ